MGLGTGQEAQAGEVSMVITQVEERKDLLACLALVPPLFLLLSSYGPVWG